jgi:hypothetical protein
VFRMNHTALIGIVVALGSLSASACGSKTPPAVGSGGGGGAGGGATDYGNSACGTCVEQTACLSQFNACAADSSCATYLKCLDACPISAVGTADPICENACPTVGGSAGQAAQMEFVACRVSGPGTMCSGCGQLAHPQDPDFNQTCTPMTDTTACFTCEDNNCCDTYNACLASSDCMAIEACYKTCSMMVPSSDTCQDQCYQEHVAGFALWAHRLDCLAYFCFDADACGIKPLDPCEKCDNLYCADVDAACAHDLQCTLLRDCETPCAPTDQSCYTTCQGQFPSGETLLNTWESCVEDHCANACGGS